MSSRCALHGLHCSNEGKCLLILIFRSIYTHAAVIDQKGRTGEHRHELWSSFMYHTLANIHISCPYMIISSSLRSMTTQAHVSIYCKCFSC